MNSILINNKQYSETELADILQKKQEESEEFEKQKKAMLNVLEDISETKEELTIRYNYIENMRLFLEKLTITTDIKSVIESMISIFEKIVPTFSNLFLFLSSNGSDSNTVYSFSKTETDIAFFKLVQQNMLDFVEQLPKQTKNKKTFIKKLQKKIFFEVLNNYSEKEITAKNYLVVPLKTRSGTNSSTENIFGLFYIVLEDINPQDLEDKKKFTNDIINISAISIERIQALTESEQSTIYDLLRSMSDGVLMFDINKKIIIANPMIEKITGINSKKITFNKISDLFKSNDIENKIDEALKTSKTVYIKEINLLQLDYDLTITPVRDYKKRITGGVIIIHDITQLKAIDKLKTEFLSVAAHQLRTPLGSVRWSLEMLLNGDMGEVSGQIKESLTRIAQSNFRMISLVNDLLDVSKIDQGGGEDQNENVDIIESIKTVISELKIEAEKRNVNFEIKTKNEPIEKIFIDPRKIRAVFQNLLSNSVKYNKQNGKVTITIEKLEKYLQITISDTGIGIPKRDQFKVFSKFFRAANAVKSETEGSGLGLFLVKSYIENWGGKMWFESVENEGSTFFIKLPIKKP